MAKTSDAGWTAITVPPFYHADYVLAYHGRDRASISEQVAGRQILKPIMLDGAPALLTIDLGDAAAGIARFRLDRATDGVALRAIDIQVRRMLGLSSDVASFETLMGSHPHRDAVIGARRGLHLPQTADAWEAVCWAVIGQQINLTFAAALRRDLIALRGTQHAGSGLVTHPDAASVAGLDVADLVVRRFSRSKAAYLIGFAQKVTDGAVVLDALAALSADQAEAGLCALHGVGPWTARYIMLRGLGFPDIAPIGDSGLATALQRLHELDRRPDPKAQEAAMRAFAPHRSLATAHLWAGLADLA